GRGLRLERTAEMGLIGKRGLLGIRGPILAAGPNEHVGCRGNTGRIWIVRLLEDRRRRARARCKPHALEPHRAHADRALGHAGDDLRTGPAVYPAVIDDKKSAGMLGGADDGVDIHGLEPDRIDDLGRYADAVEEL